MEDALRFRFAQYEERALDELLGFVRGVLADDQVNDDEAIALQAWVRANPAVTSAWPGRALAERLARVFDDGAVDDEERADLSAFLRDMVGARAVGSEASEAPTRLPLCTPPPRVLYDASRTFVFTGTMLYGRRADCQKAVTVRGGAVKDVLTRQTRYLVIGSIGSKAWVHSTHGRKIEEAVALRDSGHPIKLISEETWSASLSS